MANHVGLKMRNSQNKKKKADKNSSKKILLDKTVVNALISME